MHQAICDNIDHQEYSDFHCKFRSRVKTLAENIGLSPEYIINHIMRNYVLSGKCNVVKNKIMIDRNTACYNDQTKQLLQSVCPLLMEEKRQARERIGQKATSQSVIAEIRAKYMYDELIDKLYTAADEHDVPELYLCMIGALDTMGLYPEPNSNNTVGYVNIVNMSGKNELIDVSKIPYVRDVCKDYVNGYTVSYTILTKVANMLLHEMEEL